MKVFQFITDRKWVNKVTDERKDKTGSIVVTLNEGWVFKDDMKSTVGNFVSVRTAALGTSRNAVFNPTAAVEKATKVPKVPKAPKAPKAPVVKTTKAVSAATTEFPSNGKILSMSKDAIRKREKRAAEKAAKAAK